MVAKAQYRAFSGFDQDFLHAPSQGNMRQSGSRLPPGEAREPPDGTDDRSTLREGFSPHHATGQKVTRLRGKPIKALPFCRGKAVLVYLLGRTASRRTAPLSTVNAARHVFRPIT